MMWQPENAREINIQFEVTLASRRVLKKHCLVLGLSEAELLNRMILAFADIDVNSIVCLTAEKSSS